MIWKVSKLKLNISNESRDNAREINKNQFTIKDLNFIVIPIKTANRHVVKYFNKLEKMLLFFSHFYFCYHNSSFYAKCEQQFHSY